MNARSRRLGVECLESRELLAADSFAGAELPTRFRGVTSLTEVAASADSGDSAWSTLQSRFAQDRAGSTRGTAANLGTISGNRSLQGRVSLADRTDVFRFEVGQQANVELELNGRLGNTNLALYNARGQRVAYSADGLRMEQLSGELSAGTYYAEVSVGRSWFASYDLSIQVAHKPALGRPTTPQPSRPPISSPPAPSNPIAPTPTPTTPVADPTPVTDPAPDNRPAPLTDVPYYGGANEWNLNTIDAPEAWAAGATGAGVTVAVVDTGVDWTHTDLASNIWRNTDEIAGDGIDNDGNGFVDDIRGWNFVSDNGNVADRQGHGTHVAGTIAAAQNGFGATGVAHEATIMPIRVLGDNGSGSTLDVAAGIRYAVDNGADIINLSLGGGFSFAVQSALNYALSNNVFVVAASGNESASIASYPAAHSATFSNVISVGAHDRSGNRARFSNLPGSGVVQVDAPGVGIYSTLVGNRYGHMSGTSMASPHVAGLAALALSRDPQLTAISLREQLTEGASRSIGGSPNRGVAATTTITSLPGASLKPIESANVQDFEGQIESIDHMMSLMASEGAHSAANDVPLLITNALREIPGASVPSSDMVAEDTGSGAELAKPQLATDFV